MKKFYSVKEKVWLKELKQTGIIEELKIKDLSAVISFYHKGEKQEGLFNFWEIDKYLSKDSLEQIPLNIFIKYFDESLPKIEKIHVGDWIDLRASQDIIMKKGGFKLIPLGIAMSLPRGYEAYVVPRGSTYKYFGIIQANHHGVVDESYRGNEDQWFYPAIAMRDTEIKKGDRICQFRIQKKMPKINFIEVGELKDNNRGGHGTTGIK